MKVAVAVALWNELKGRLFIALALIVGLVIGGVVSPLTTEVPIPEESAPLALSHYIREYAEQAIELGDTAYNITIEETWDEGGAAWEMGVQSEEFMATLEHPNLRYIMQWRGVVIIDITDANPDGYNGHDWYSLVFVWCEKCEEWHLIDIWLWPATN